MKAQDGDERLAADAGNGDPDAGNGDSGDPGGEERAGVRGPRSNGGGSRGAERPVAEGEGSGDARLAELEALREQAAANSDKYLRAVAELENVRRRAARDVENARRYGLERLAQALLPVIDSLEAGLASAEQATAESLLDGTRATMRLMNSALEQVGIGELDPHGEPFDPAEHEAMAVAPSDSAEPGTVIEVFQKGYAIHGRLLRAARVIVAREPAENGE